MPINTHARTCTFFGQPMALVYFSFTEAWERFSYYGMTAILVLYMSQALLLPGHVQHIVGFTGFRAPLESAFGSMSTLALASQIMGLYTGLAYFTPVLGRRPLDRPTHRRDAGRRGDDRWPSGDGVRCLVPAGAVPLSIKATMIGALEID